MTKETVGSRVRSPVSGSARVVVEAIDDSADPSEYCRGEISELCNTYPVRCRFKFPVVYTNVPNGKKYMHPV